MKARCCGDERRGAHPKCPRCESDETRRVRNYGRPVEHEWWCLKCWRRWIRDSRALARELGDLDDVPANAMTRAMLLAEIRRLEAEDTRGEGEG